MNATNRRRRINCNKPQKAAFYKSPTVWLQCTAHIAEIVFGVRPALSQLFTVRLGRVGRRSYFTNARSSDLERTATDRVVCVENGHCWLSHEMHLIPIFCCCKANYYMTISRSSRYVQYTHTQLSLSLTQWGAIHLGLTNIMEQVSHIIYRSLHTVVSWEEREARRSAANVCSIHSLACNFITKGSTARCFTVWVKRWRICKPFLY